MLYIFSRTNVRMFNFYLLHVVDKNILTAKNPIYSTCICVVTTAAFCVKLFWLRIVLFFMAVYIVHYVYMYVLYIEYM